MSEQDPNTADVPYMQRTRDFYRAQGYSKDYRWAHFDTVPFTKLEKPLNVCRVGLISTAMPDTPEGRAQRQVYSCPVSPIPESMYTDELSWHKSVTHTDDVGSFIPIEQIQLFVAEKRLGSINESFYTVPTEYSQRNTMEKDAPEILSRCIQDEIDVAILAPL